MRNTRDLKVRLRFLTKNRYCMYPIPYTGSTLTINISICISLLPTQQTTFIELYLTIRLRARNFCDVIVSEGEARVNYRFIGIESEQSNCFSKNKLVFVISSRLFRKTRNKHCFFRNPRPCRVTRRCSISIDEYIASSVAGKVFTKRIFL